MTPPTIDRIDVIDLFEQLMQPVPPHRVLRLLGASKMGKSHLLNNVFAPLAHQNYRVPCAVVNLKDNSVTVARILHQLCAQLGGEPHFPTYHAAHDAWLNQSNKVEAKGLLAVFSSISIRTGKAETDPQWIERQLTTKFGADLQNLAAKPILLLFDQLDNSPDTIQNWLMDELLVSLAVLKDVRVIVAGQSVPDAAGSYATACCSYELPPVEDENAYIDYCRHCQLNISDQSIKDFAFANYYNPGSFVESVYPRFLRRGGAVHG